MSFEKFHHHPDRPIIFTDLEMTGLSTKQHEIIEIGAVLTTPDLEIINELNVKVAPKHIETATPRALEVNGYTPEDWIDAISLEEALEIFSDTAIDATFIAHNAPFDLRFIDKAFEDTRILNLMSTHRIDNLAFARAALEGKVKSFTQESISMHFGFEPEPAIHRAVNGARLVRQNYSRLVEL